MTKLKRLAASFFILFVLLNSSAFAEELKGVVLGLDGAPLADAEVRLCSSEMMSPSAVVYDSVKSDQAGQFTVTVPKRWFAMLTTWRQEMSLSVETSGGDVGVASISRYLPLPQQRIVVQLKKFTTRRITVTTHDGQPVVGKKVQLTMLLGTSTSDDTSRMSTAVIPEGTWQSHATTNDAGQVELNLPPAKQVGGLSVETNANTTVNWTRYSQPEDSAKDWYTKLKLPKLRSIPVNIEYSGELRDLKLQVNSRPQSQAVGGASISVQTLCTSDKNGKMEAIVSPDSYINMTNKNPGAKGHLLNTNMLTTLMKTNGLKKIDLKYGRGTKIKAQVVTKDKKPAANIEVMVFSGSKTTTVTTDTEGRIESIVAPGYMMVVPVGGGGYRIDNLSPQSAIRVPVDKKEFDAGQVVVLEQSSFIGIVESENGPAADASVYAQWSAPSSRGNVEENKRRYKTDKAGRFEIHNVDVGQQIRIAAYCDSGATEDFQMFSVTKLRDPQTVELRKSALISVTGRVVDHDEKPLASVPVLLRHRLRAPATDPQLPNGDDLNLELKTDENGKYKTNAVLPPWGEYIAVIRPTTKRETYSGWKNPGKTEVELPPIREGRTRNITGQVVDMNGKPVSAVVSLLTSNDQEQVNTESDGRFLLKQSSGVAPVIIAEAKGYLTSGQFLTGESASTPITLRMVKPDQAVAATVSNDNDESWSLEKRQQLALKLYKDFGDVDKRVKDRIDSKLARYMPDEILKRIDTFPAAKTRQGQMIRASLAVGLSKTRPDKAREILGEIPEGPGRMFAFKSFEEVADLSNDDRMELLAQLVQEIRGMKDPQYRVISMGFAAERLMDMGQRETGEQLLRETFDDAKKLAPAAWSAYARGAFAEEMAQVDAAAAWKLIEPIKDVSEFNRHTKNTAHELAAIDPATAEKWLGKFRKPKDGSPQAIVEARDDAVVRVCYRMVRVDPDRAVKLAKSVKASSLRVYALGVMVESLLSTETVSDVDRTLARKIHDEAWDELANIRANEDLSKVAWLFPSTMAAALCRATSGIAPEQLSHRIWQTIALRRPMAKSGTYQPASQGSVCDMALLLCDVDRTIAKQLTQWLPTAEAGTEFTMYSQVSRNATDLMVELNPEQCEPAIANADRARRDRLVMNMIASLVRTGDARRRSIISNMALWYPDDEDMGPID